MLTCFPCSLIQRALMRPSRHQFIKIISLALNKSQLFYQIMHYFQVTISLNSDVLISRPLLKERREVGAREHKKKVMAFLSSRNMSKVSVASTMAFPFLLLSTVFFNYSVLGFLDTCDQTIKIIRKEK